MPLTTKKTAPAADTNGKDDPGKPQDALTAIVAEISKTPATATPDVKVTRAVAAGWHAREALTAARRADAEAAGSIHPRSHEGHAFLVLQHARGELHKAFREHPITDDEPLAVAAHDAPPPSFVSDGAAPRGELLGTISDVSAAQRLAVACSQLSADLAALKSALIAGGQDPELVAADLKALTTTPDLHTAAAERLACRFVQELLAADYRLGKAYALGWDMATLGEATTYAEFSTRFTTAYPRIRERLTALASLLPPNVGHAVRSSVDRWKEAMHPRQNDKSARNKRRREAIAKVTIDDDSVKSDRIKYQVQTWRTLLTGEKAAKDVSQSDDLVSIAARTMSRLAAAIGHGVAERWKAFVGLVATVVIVFGAGVAAIAVWGEGGDVAGLTAIIGSLGLTWKGVGSTIGRGLAKVEQPLWDSQVDGAIADVITKLPSSDEDMIYLDALAESPEPVAGG